MSALDRLRRITELEQLLDRAGIVNDTFLAVAAEKDPTREPQVVLEEMFTKANNALLQPDADYKTRLDLMAADLGPEHFAPVRSSANFQDIFEKWCNDYGQRQYQKMLTALSEWTGGKATPEDVETLMKAAAAALQLQSLPD